MLPFSSSFHILPMRPVTGIWGGEAPAATCAGEAQAPRSALPPLRDLLPLAPDDGLASAFSGTADASAWPQALLVALRRTGLPRHFRRVGVTEGGDNTFAQASPRAPTAPRRSLASEAAEPNASGAATTPQAAFTLRFSPASARWGVVFAGWAAADSAQGPLAGSAHGEANCVMKDWAYSPAGGPAAKPRHRIARASPYKRRPKQGRRTREEAIESHLGP
mmetsp:Transcript_58336/g.128006  ORF Transcript_58336/g.128006 Transcript_58336/m.128006 type:complete len:220 (+) Transcript_58336:953-1612(+)